MINYKNLPIIIFLLVSILIVGCSSKNICPSSHPYYWLDNKCHKYPKCPDNAPYYWESDGMCHNKDFEIKEEISITKKENKTISQIEKNKTQNLIYPDDELPPQVPSNII